MDVLFTFSPPEELLKPLKQVEADLNLHTVSSIDEENGLLAEAEVLVTFGEDLTEGHIRKAQKVKWIMVVSAGLEKMPLDAIAERGILLTNAKGIHKKPMAEFTIGLMIQYVKQLGAFRDQQREGIWRPDLKMGELSGKNLMIVGAGAIGTEIAKAANFFGMAVYGVNSTGKPIKNFQDMYTIESFKEALPIMDFIINILPSTDKTKYLYQKEHFTAMKETAVFINIGRGDAVSEEVLIEALEEERIAHAFMDVFETEPLPEGHPFWKLKNLTLTPHVSSHSDDYLPRAFEIFKHNLHTYINNKNNFMNVVDPKRGY
ncbi:D-2-hydroxyacid dehydrogenase [Falsibacillus pallidus]|uniref:Phosphoglycerate dehydrogenase-like enzyme n=1 Tax=Falsibacillus pallidus TaxID=493781 RepID=A0A370FZV3_9BACI|nr:D-2-hydroxyacid dehydrogenase [Falsibacillus pallidus]RDI37187.1 phosphoglycerate dehydrogenase-like enzyme [Falsibacillus pallidus]